MFILSFVNLKDNHEVDSVAAEHKAFLERFLESGVFLAAGAKVPRTGGVIVAQGVSRAEIDAIIADAPFVRHGFARVEVTEFKAYLVAPGIKLSPVEAA
jgi:uncharacterized protein YciI